MKKTLLYVLLLLLAGACTNKSPKIYLGQGIMSGEADTNSVILQSRLTSSDTLVDNDLLGSIGFGQFEISTDPSFKKIIKTEVIEALEENDYIIKKRVLGLKAGTKYYYRFLYGYQNKNFQTSSVGRFNTLPGKESSSKVSMIVTTGMNYYHFHYGKYDRHKAYSGADKELGYPALAAIKSMNPDYFIGTGDNVYFDHPAKRGMEKAKKAGKDPHPGLFGGVEVFDEIGIRKKYHVQFIQPRFKDLFSQVSTYWEKDDHDYRLNDADPYTDFPISHELGISSFLEQLPLVDPEDANPITYRTFRMNKDLQIWLLEGRDYRSPNDMEVSDEKTLLGKEQISWLKSTLLNSDATFKLIISPTPMVGPDDLYKSDNHVNPRGFKHEGDYLFSWFKENDFLKKNLYIVCGDRHWKYHAMHPSGFEEFSCGALVDNNSRAGRIAGDKGSTDPDALITQFFNEGTPESASGGFLKIEVYRKNDVSIAKFGFYNERGDLLYSTEKTPR
jgi:alkaline phosphatase/alkaline phosphatase D